MCFLFCVVVREFLLTMRETGLLLLDSRVFSVFFFFASSRRLLVRKKNFTQNNNNNTKVKSSLNCGVLLIKTTKEVR